MKPLTQTARRQHAARRRRNAARRLFVPMPEALEKRLAPATLTVEPSIDLRDDHPGDGICRSIDPSTGSTLINPATGLQICTLRAAIMEANALADTDPISGLPVADEIVLKPGLYMLNQPNARTNPLAITSELTIRADSANGAN